MSTPSAAMIAGKNARNPWKARLPADTDTRSRRMWVLSCLAVSFQPTDVGGAFLPVRLPVRLLDFELPAVSPPSLARLRAPHLPVPGSASAHRNARQHVTVRSADAALAATGYAVAACAGGSPRRRSLEPVGRSRGAVVDGAPHALRAERHVEVAHPERLQRVHDRVLHRDSRAHGPRLPDPFQPEWVTR